MQWDEPMKVWVVMSLLGGWLGLTLVYQIFMPRLRHRPSGRDFPAMIGGVQIQHGGKAPVLGVHRTYLTAEGGKAPVPDAKMSLGRVKGGAVRFGPPAVTVAVAEGIETALSVATACPGLVVWAALSTSGVKSLILPAAVKTVILCPDGDVEGAGAARQAADRFLEEGRQVRIAQAPAGADLNDVLLGRAGQAYQPVDEVGPV